MANKYANDKYNRDLYIPQAKIKQEELSKRT